MGAHCWRHIPTVSANGMVAKISWELFRQTLLEQAEQVSSALPYLHLYLYLHVPAAAVAAVWEHTAGETFPQVLPTAWRPRSPGSCSGRRC